MSGTPGNGNGFRVWIPWSLVLAAAAALIAMHSDVQGLKEEIKTKTPRDVEQAHYEAIVQRLDRIERKVDARP